MNNTHTVVSIEEPVILLAIIHNFVLCLHATYIHYCSQTLSQTNIKTAKSLANITLVTLLSFISLNVVSFLTMISQKYFPDVLSCNIWIAMCLIAYYSSKFFFWYYCTIRLKLAFKESPPLQYNKLTLNSLKLIFFFIAITLCINFYFNITTFKQDQHCWSYVNTSRFLLIIISFVNNVISSLYLHKQSFIISLCFDCFFNTQLLHHFGFFHLMDLFKLAAMLFVIGYFIVK